MLLCVVAAILVDSSNFGNFTLDQIRRALTVDILLPALLAGPLLFLLLRKIRALAIAHDEMVVLATTDSLTGILNRGAFTMMVEAYLAQTKLAASDSRAALLVIDADHFKTINDQFGHSSGDEALRRIAGAIQAALRSADLVGRIGGEEFGVLLPATSGPQALQMAERIRNSVREIPFPGSDQNLLSVTIGGVNFHPGSSYDRLFKVADQCLYLAKDGGRNQVKMISYIDQLAA